MNRALGYLTLIIFLMLMAFQLHCGGNSCGVTETCNPTVEASSTDDGGDGSGILDGDAGIVPTGDGVSDNDSGGDMAAAPLVVTDLLNTACELLDACYTNVTLSTCQDSLNTDANMLLEFGVDTSLYASFDAVQDAIEADELSVDETEFANCQTELEALSCAAIEAAGAFDDATLQDYSNAFKMIPDDC